MKITLRDAKVIMNRLIYCDDETFFFLNGRPTIACCYWHMDEAD